MLSKTHINIETWLVVPFGEHNGAYPRHCEAHMLNNKAMRFMRDKNAWPKGDQKWHIIYTRIQAQI